MAEMVRKLLQRRFEVLRQCPEGLPPRTVWNGYRLGASVVTGAMR